MEKKEGHLTEERQNVAEKSRSVAETNRETGLTEAEAAKRLAADGANELEQEKKKSPCAAFLGQLNDPLICVLLVAAFVSFLLHEISDAVIIGVVVLVNTVVGVIQEGKAQKALDSLKKLTSPRAVVRRDSVVREIAAAELVVGDVVILETGSQVPADLRLVQAWNLKTRGVRADGRVGSGRKDF